MKWRAPTSVGVPRLHRLITPLTEPATIWVRRHLEHEESLYWCGALVVEPRYLGPIVAGMADDGLVIQAE